MNKEIKDKWVAALRSGEYRQGTGQLRAPGINQDGEQIASYCCLGVLCELAVDAGVVERTLDAYTWKVGDLKNTESGVLPIPVRDWAGMETGTGILSNEVEYVESGPFSSSRTAVSLVQLNDSEEFDFDAIADVIEAQF